MDFYSAIFKVIIYFPFCHLEVFVIIEISQRWTSSLSLLPLRSQSNEVTCTLHPHQMLQQHQPHQARLRPDTSYGRANLEKARQRLHHRDATTAL